MRTVIALLLWVSTAQAMTGAVYAASLQKGSTPNGAAFTLSLNSPLVSHGLADALFYGRVAHIQKAGMGTTPASIQDKSGQEVNAVTRVAGGLFFRGAPR
jgi:hypothetical protein